jgi:hypothetical protein
MIPFGCGREVEPLARNRLSEGVGMDRGIDAFVKEYPPEREQSFNGATLAATVTKTFGVKVPRSLIRFWNQAGYGYFSDRELNFFGPDGPGKCARSLVSWNSLPCWADLLNPPSQGCPVFIAETCVGDQIGFRYGSDGSCKAVLLAIDTCELFVMTPDFADLIPHLLSDPHTIVDPELLAILRQQLGPLPNDSHYAPIVSPLVGGSFAPTNYHIETAVVHVGTVIATWKALT